MSSYRMKALPWAMLLVLGAGHSAVWANPYDDEEGFHGYFRDGAGSSSTHGPQSCFGLGGNTMKYRLGNECDAYFEGGYTKEFAKTDDGARFVGTIWLNDYSPHSDFAGSKPEIAKAYVEAKNIDFLGGGTAWVGKRYYFRPDIHMLDLQYINMNGTGGGIDKIPMGAGKFSYAIFKDNDLTSTNPGTGQVTSSSALRQNFIYQDVPVNPGGTIDLALTLISPHGGDNTHSGWQISAFHRQSGVWGGGNTVGFQYGVGPGTGVGGACCDRMGSSGSTQLGSDVKRTRLFDDIWIQPTKEFGMEFVALVQKDQSDLGGSSTWTSVGARPSYAFSRHFKLQAELGVDRVTSPNGGPAQRLTKLTIAPTISMDQGFWSRPELRLFVTYGKWNDAATAAINANNNSGPVYGSNTSGASVGLQVETWW